MDFKNNEVIEDLLENNDESYNLVKASEECQELGLVLIQYTLKPHKVNKQEIIDEIGDVIIRLEVLKKIFSIEKIEERVKYKLDKFKNYREKEIYPNI